MEELKLAARKCDTLEDFQVRSRDLYVAWIPLHHCFRWIYVLWWQYVIIKLVVSRSLQSDNFSPNP